MTNTASLDAATLNQAIATGKPIWDSAWIMPGDIVRIHNGLPAKVIDVQGDRRHRQVSAEFVEVWSGMTTFTAVLAWMGDDDDVEGQSARSITWTKNVDLDGYSSSPTTWDGHRLPVAYRPRG